MTVFLSPTSAHFCARGGRTLYRARRAYFALFWRIFRSIFRRAAEMVLDSNSAPPSRQNASMLSNARAARLHGPSNLARGPVPHATGIGLRLRPWVCELGNHPHFHLLQGVNARGGPPARSKCTWREPRHGFTRATRVTRGFTRAPRVTRNIFNVMPPDLSTARAAPLDTIRAGQAPDAPHIHQS